jgi:hypothetical protein
MRRKGHYSVFRLNEQNLFCEGQTKNRMSVFTEKLDCFGFARFSPGDHNGNPPVLT